MDVRRFTKGIAVLMLLGGIAAGRAAADPPVWAAQGRHDRNDSDRQSTWRGERPALTGTLSGRWQRGDRSLTLRADGNSYRVYVSRADMGGVRDIRDGARVLVWGKLGRDRVLEATRVEVVSMDRPDNPHYGGSTPGDNRPGSYGGHNGDNRPGSYGGHEGGYRPGGYDGDRYGRSLVLYGIVTRLDTRGCTFSLRANASETYTVHVTEDTRVLSKGEKASWGDVREGGRVRVEGTLSRGTVEASVLEGFGK